MAQSGGSGGSGALLGQSPGLGLGLFDPKREADIIEQKRREGLIQERQQQEAQRLSNPGSVPAQGQGAKDAETQRVMGSDRGLAQLPTSPAPATKPEVPKTAPFGPTVTGLGAMPSPTGPGVPQGSTVSVGLGSIPAPAPVVTPAPVAPVTPVPEGPQAPDYIGTAKAQQQILNQQNAQVWQNQLDLQLQRAKEQGTEGQALTALMSHLSAGNQAGLINARQQVLLDALHQQAAFDERNFFQQQAWDREDKNKDVTEIWTLLNSNWGDEAAVNAALDMGIAMLGEDSIFGELKRNPVALRNLQDEGYAAMSAERNAAASAVLQNIIDPMDQVQVDQAFGDYFRAKYGNGESLFLPESWSTDTVSEEVMNDFTELNGAFDPNSPEDLRKLYAYDLYRKDVDKSFRNELATEAANEFVTSGGDPEVAARIRELGPGFVATFMDPEATVRMFGDDQTVSDPVDGPLSFLFSDWDGNLYESQSDWENRSVLDQNLDKLWMQYLQDTSEKGGDPMSRQEFSASVSRVVSDYGLPVDALTGVLLSDAGVGQYLSAMSKGAGAVEAGMQVAMDADPAELYAYIGQNPQAAIDQGFSSVRYDELGTLDPTSDIYALGEKGITPGAVIVDKQRGPVVIGSIKLTTDSQGRKRYAIYLKEPMSDGTLKLDPTPVEVAEPGFSYTAGAKDQIYKSDSPFYKSPIPKDLFLQDNWK